MNLLWFRRDLRLTDNEIVALAAENNASVLPFFIIDPWFYQWEDVGQARVRFLFESLEDLHKNLQRRGSYLTLFEGNAVEIIQQLTQYFLDREQSPKLYFNRDVQVEYGVTRDREIVEFYQASNLDYHLGLNHFLQLKDDRDRWFSEYYTYQRATPYTSPSNINTPPLSIPIKQLSFPQLKRKYREFWQMKKVYFKGGESRAMATLDSFLERRFEGYHWKLSRPWLAQRGATSHLSPHLTFGTISTREVYQQTKARAVQLSHIPKVEFSLKNFRDRLRWHDSFTQRLYFYPEIAYQNRYPEFDDWYTPAQLSPQKQELFQAWQDGMTGFPLVDASMRQLKVMGWMNFRMRAMCATFLTINCGISWHHGARHYMNYLVDGDLAIDNWQWQMQAGITNPLSETFRIYNPNKNIQEKDPNLRFIHHWVEELKVYNISDILAGKYLTESAYPKPILDWSQTRKINGKIVSNLRKQVKERLLAEGGEEYDNAKVAKRTVEKYRQYQEREYAQMNSNLDETASRFSS
ncbi:FAD-binding domain-containing protein [Oscillatoria sp. FACHB-1406]|uniref:FAD-binding domain-containing protein n=1 Tax=Oscillatoria sp. FACHB-1406 TaxID=2692846 RepID=UPI00168222B1|nr:FAD-binding domain-containing protein [Oscillatoria sp. FACHB-1406]MBD2578159.1 deoxyribodipyrimidine photo-lyase [Oscillatoria sp. FACHB-1406]